MYHSALKMVASPTSSSLLPHFTTTTVHQETPGSTRDESEDLEELGAQKEAIEDSSFSSTLEDLLE